MNPTLDTTYSKAALGSQQRSDDLLAAGKKLLATEPATPVSVISTDDAIAEVDKGLTNLNQFSPSTQPGYIPRTIDMSTPRVQPVEPKAYFTNDAGQEAEYTEQQLKSRKIQKLLREGGYVQTRTEGPNFDTAAELRDEVSDLDRQLEDLNDDFQSFNPDDDDTYKAINADIKAKFDQLRKETERANTQRAQAYKTLGYRAGTTQYAGATQLGLEGEELRQGNERLAEINNLETSAIMAARNAYQTGRFEEFTKKMDALEKLRDDKTETLTAYNATLAAATKKIRETTVQAARDGAIASLLSQGVTDATDILGALNYDEKGNQVGDFTADEVAKALKSLAPDGDIDGLTGEVKNFFILKKNNALPGNISSLPEDQQLSAWRDSAKAAPKVNALTVKEATVKGLPLELVGQDEEAIDNSFVSEAPPAWFVSKAKIETGQDNIIPETVQGLWETYRAEYLANLKNDATTKFGLKKDAALEQARDYFTSTYGEIADEDMQIYLDMVETLMDGGKTYGEAIKQIEEEAQ